MSYIEVYKKYLVSFCNKTKPQIVCKTNIEHSPYKTNFTF